MKLMVVMLILLIPTVWAECVVPAEGMVFTKDTTLCQGTYNLFNGISLQGSNFTLDCQGSTLAGRLIHVGITVDWIKHIKNCTIKDYDVGVITENDYPVTLEDVTIFGTRLAKAARYTNFTPFVFEMTINNSPTIEDFRKVGISKKTHERALEKVTLKKSLMLIDDDNMTFFINLTAKEDVKEIEIYETLSKNDTGGAENIRASDGFEIIVHDPIIKFSLKDMRKGEMKSISYTYPTGKFIDIDNPPKTILILERKTGQTKDIAKKLVSGIFVLGILFVIYSIWKKGKTQKKPKRIPKRLQ